MTTDLISRLERGRWDGDNAAFPLPIPDAEFLGVRLREKDYRRFASFIDASSTGCIEWRGSTYGGGYGRFSIRHRDVAAHRTSYLMFVGPIPEGLVVCHKCDNRRCVRPDHLWLGTITDNNRDRSAKHRGKVVKVSHEEALVVRRRLIAGETVTSLAIAYGINRSSVRKIRLRAERILSVRAGDRP